MILVKNPESISELLQLHPAMRNLLIWLEPRWPIPNITITRIKYPPVPNESGVHQTVPHRGVDLRTSDLAPASRPGVVALINANWHYGGDPGKRVALLHAVDGGAEHLHLQVRDETVYTPVGDTI